MESPVEKLADVEFHQDGQETQENKLYLPAQWGSIFCNLERDKHVEVVLFFCVNRFVLFCLLPQDFYCYDKTQYQNAVWRRKGLFQLIVHHFSIPLKDVRTGA